MVINTVFAILFILGVCECFATDGQGEDGLASGVYSHSRKLAQALVHNASYVQKPTPPGKVHGVDRYPGWKGSPGYNHPNDGDEGNEGEAPAPAPTAAPIPTPELPPPDVPPAGNPKAYFTAPGATCPDIGAGTVTTGIGAGEHKPAFLIKDKAANYYIQNPEIETITTATNKKIKLDYTPIQSGGTYCWSAPKPKILVGGTVFFHKGNKCHLPPSKADGSSCCKMYAWQPNHDGYYYNDCSATLDIGGDGAWWVYTEMPGDESIAGWGPDNQPHIHYDVRCSECSGLFTNLKTSKGDGWWNKWYPLDVCKVQGCGKTGPQHAAIDNTTIDGVQTFKYNMVIAIE